MLVYILLIFIFFFFNDTATTEIYTLSLHDALPISQLDLEFLVADRIATDQHAAVDVVADVGARAARPPALEQVLRSEEHTSELQSRQYLVCRLLLEKKKSERPPLRSPGDHHQALEN